MGDVGPDLRTDSSDDLAVGVAVLVRDRCAVEGEEDGVPGPMLLELGKEVPDHDLEGLGSDGGHGCEAVENERDEVDAGLVAKLQVATEGRLGFGELTHEVLALDGASCQPSIERCHDWRVGVRLVA